MNIKGFLKSSFVDWEGKISAVIFLPGCNLRCPWCYNINLVENPEKIQTITWAVIRNYLEQAKDWIDGIVITGGEPTVHIDLPVLCRKIKSAGFAIKLDTNGTNPEMIERLINKKMIDYVALDVKAPLDPQKYARVSGVSNEEIVKKVKKTISILMTAGVPYEFRTTVIPELHTLEDIKSIARYVGVCKNYIIQPYMRADTLSIRYSKLEPFSELQLMSFVRAAQKEAPNARKR